MSLSWTQTAIAPRKKQHLTPTLRVSTHFTDPTQIPDSSLGHRPRQIFELHLQYLFYLGSSRKLGKFINMLMMLYLKFQP